MNVERDDECTSTAALTDRRCAALVPLSSSSLTDDPQQVAAEEEENINEQRVEDGEHVLLHGDRGKEGLEPRDSVTN